MAKILIIDDDRELCTILSVQITSLGHKTSVAYTIREGYDLFLREYFDVIFLDVRLPDGSGLDILPMIRQKEHPPEVIIMTGSSDADGAEIAVSNGAWDYIQKPYSLKQMMLPLTRALDYREARASSGTKVILDLDGVVCSSRSMKNCVEILAQTARIDANVLLTGETGTGKEVFAMAIHKNSKRAAREFVVVDCGALPETLVESILFGHEKGAYTGADRKRDGLLKTADGGTLFLDEVGELPLGIQRSLLRTLQERRFRPIGGDKEVGSDFRLIAATNRDLDELVKQGLFREDLLHRLRNISIHLPPLREREGDLQKLVMYFVGRICSRIAEETKGVSPEFLDILQSYSWPGNIRELQHVLERTIINAMDSPVLYPGHLPTEIRAEIAKTVFGRQEQDVRSATEAPDKPFPTLKAYEDELREQYVEELIRCSKGNYLEACRLSGMSKSKLYQLLKACRKTLKS